LLDRTGSMSSIKDETIGGFNAYLDTLEREVGDLVEFTLLQFDSQSIDTLYVGAKLSAVERLTPETYQPRAYTPQIDACFNIIKLTEQAVARRRDKPRVIVVSGSRDGLRLETMSMMSSFDPSLFKLLTMPLLLSAEVKASAACFVCSSDLSVALTNTDCIEPMGMPCGEPSRTHPASVRMP
jgi:hypothetical protein